MSRLELYLTPLQWEEISTYEARVKIITLCEERLVIECKNSMACSKLTGTNLPEPLKMKPRNFSLINKMTLSIENPKFFFIKCVMYCSYTNQHIKSSDGEEIKISKQWGNPDSSLNHYSILIGVEKFMIFLDTRHAPAWLWTRSEGLDCKVQLAASG